MVAAPRRGEMNQPASIEPTMPTTMFRKMPCCASVRMTLLAIQPIRPPRISQTMKLTMIVLPPRRRGDGDDNKSRAGLEEILGRGSIRGGSSGCGAGKDTAMLWKGQLS